MSWLKDNADQKKEEFNVETSEDESLDNNVNIRNILKIFLGGEV